MWDIFKNTGNIEAYLYHKKYNDSQKINKDYKIGSTEVDLLEEVKINSI